MKAARLNKVKDEMERLAETIRDLEAHGHVVSGHCPLDPQRIYGGSRLTGAVRRASLDLTMALADLRRR